MLFLKQPQELLVAGVLLDVVEKILDVSQEQGAVAGHQVEEVQVLLLDVYQRRGVLREVALRVVLVFDLDVFLSTEVVEKFIDFDKFVAVVAQSDLKPCPLNASVVFQDLFLVVDDERH